MKAEEIRDLLNHKKSVEPSINKLFFAKKSKEDFLSLDYNVILNYALKKESDKLNEKNRLELKTQEVNKRYRIKSALPNLPPFFKYNRKAIKEYNSKYPGDFQKIYQETQEETIQNYQGGMGTFVTQSPVKKI